MFTLDNLNDQIFRMNARGGYILAFSKAVAIALPELTWTEYSRRLRANGTFCGYGDQAVRNAFGR